MKFSIFLILAIFSLGSCSDNSKDKSQQASDLDCISNDIDLLNDSDELQPDQNSDEDNVSDKDSTLPDSNDSDEEPDIDSKEDFDVIQDSDMIDDSDIIDFPRVKVGEVAIYKMIYGGEASKDTSIKADFWNMPVIMDAFAPFVPDVQEEILTEGGCTIYKAATLACNPACEWDEYCSSESICLKKAVRVNAGKITVTYPGGKTELQGGNDYPYYGSIPENGFAAGEKITVTASGDFIPAFEMEATIPEIFAASIKDNLLELFDDKDTIVSWEPFSGGIVRAVINNGWHGADPDATIYCTVDAAAGELVIPKEISALYPITTGVGLEPHTSFIEYISIDTENTNKGFVDLILSYRSGLYLKHE